MQNYILVEWPESQSFMEKEWFEEEAILGESSSYFIPEERFIDNDYIIKKVKSLAEQLNSPKEEEEYINKEWEKAIPFEGAMSTFEHILAIKNDL